MKSISLYIILFTNDKNVNGTTFLIVYVCSYYISKSKLRCYNNNLLKLRRKVFSCSAFGCFINTLKVQKLYKITVDDGLLIVCVCVHELQSFVLLGIKGQEK